jgi:hypothetical protein
MYKNQNQIVNSRKKTTKFFTARVNCHVRTRKPASGLNSGKTLLDRTHQKPPRTKDDTLGSFM